MRYTDIFIDFDDTLYDTHGNSAIALSEVFQKFSLGNYFKNADEFYKSYWLANMILWDEYAHGKIEKDYLIVERFRRPLSEGICPDGSLFNPSEEFCMQIHNEFLVRNSEKSGTVEYAKELVEYLKNKGYRLHICSNGFHEVQYKKLRACGLLPFFDSIILSEDAGANKPNAQFFEYAFAKSEAQKESTVMIGDNYFTDILGARNAGLDTIFFNAHPEDFAAPEPVTYEVKCLKDILNIL
ncbi:MAG: YjjG family noncanonical pyrimidine nucleotidase [Bacteroidaceae bacterium]|nr:YjjG family noncanonical pyrimidine nucleotidase [Bacteroidaceae bacterium]